MATVGQICYKVPIQEKNLSDDQKEEIATGITFTTEEFIKNGINHLYGVKDGNEVTNEVISFINPDKKEENYPTKIGIQAPAGTQFVMNKKTMMIGRTGILELEDVKITELYFIRPGTYEVDTDATKDNITKGKAALGDNNAKNIKVYIDNIVDDENASDNNNFEENVANLQKASEKVQEALTLLQIGTVYKAVENNPNDLSNVIIDYMY